MLNSLVEVYEGRPRSKGKRRQREHIHVTDNTKQNSRITSRTTIHTNSSIQRLSIHHWCKPSFTNKVNLPVHVVTTRTSRRQVRRNKKKVYRYQWKQVNWNMGLIINTLSNVHYNLVGIFVLIFPYVMYNDYIIRLSTLSTE